MPIQSLTRLPIKALGETKHSAKWGHNEEMTGEKTLEALLKALAAGVQTEGMVGAGVLEQGKMGHQEATTEV